MGIGTAIAESLGAKSANLILLSRSEVRKSDFGPRVLSNA